MHRSRIGAVADADESSAVSPMKRHAQRVVVHRLRKSGTTQGVNAKAKFGLMPSREEKKYGEENVADHSNVAETESEEVKQLRLELSEVLSALSREKRSIQQLKLRVGKSQKDLSIAEKDVEQVNKKLEHAAQLVAAGELHNRQDLLEQNLELDDQISIARQELITAEAQLRLLNAAASQTHHGKLQRDVAKIRTSDDSRKLAAWKKKVVALENSVALLRSEVVELRTSGKGATTTSTALGEDSCTADADAALEIQKKTFSTQLAKLQEDISREARAAQENHSKSRDDLVKRNQALNVEVAHLDQQRASKESDAKRLLLDVERLTKLVDAARKKRDAMESDRQGIVKERENAAKEIEQHHLNVQEASVSLNQLILMSSEAPQMHEKAWSQEKAGLQASLNSAQQRSKKLEQDIHTLEARVESVRQDVNIESTLCNEEAEVLKQLDKLRVSLQHVLNQQAAVKSDDSVEVSQKDRIISDLEGAIRTERRHIEEMQSMNDRLNKKLDAAKSLLQKNGFDC